MAARAAEGLQRNALASIAQHCREPGLSSLDHSIWLAVFPFRLDVWLWQNRAVTEGDARPQTAQGRYLAIHLCVDLGV